MAVILIAAMAVLWVQAHRKAALVLCLGTGAFVLGLLSMRLHLQAVEAQADVATASPVSSYTLLVETDPKLSDTGNLTARARLSDKGGVDRGTVWVSVSPQVQGADQLRMGKLVTAVGRWGSLSDDDWGRDMRVRGVCASVRLFAIEDAGWQAGPLGWVRRLRDGLHKSLNALPSDDGRALLAGVVLGYQSDASGSQLQGDFQTLGLSHLVAVSGSHLAVVAGVVLALAGSVGARPWARFAVLVALLSFYVVLTGLQASALRSLLMLSAALVAGLAHRRSHALSALSLCALFLLLCRPSMAGDLGFGLSVLSVLGLCAFGSYGCELARRLMGPRCPQALPDAVAMTLVAQAFTLPLTIPAFGMVSLLSPLANALVGPLVSGALACGLVCVPLASLVPALALPPYLLAKLVCLVSHFLAGVPYAAVPIAASGPLLACLLFVACAAVYLFWPLPSGRRLRIGSIACLTCVFVALNVSVLLAPTRVLMLNVGQGDAILVQDGPHAMLVDTGPDEAVVQALGRARVARLDAVLLTHTDADHVGGLDDMVGLVGVSRIVVAQGVWESVQAIDPDLEQAILATGGQVVSVSAGDCIQLGSYTLEVLWPTKPVEGNSNDQSLVCLLSRPEREGQFSMLLTGDAEDDVVSRLVAQGAVGDIDVLKVGHHGSAVSISPETMQSLAPEAAIVSAGQGNRYGHPREECLDVLEQGGAAVWCTIWCQDIDVRLSERGYEILSSGQPEQARAP